VLFDQPRTIGVGLITAAGNRVAAIAAHERDAALTDAAERGRATNPDALLCDQVTGA
jgi:hypothetical protein